MAIESTVWDNLVKLVMPFSGSVDMDYHPFTDWSSHTARQLGFINVYTMQSDNPDLEQGITRDVAGYGMQLERVIEALNAICHQENIVPQDYHKTWDPDHTRAMDSFIRLADEIQEYKREHQSPTLTQASIKDSIKRLIEVIEEEYKREHQSPTLTQAAFKEAFERLITVLKERDTGGSDRRRQLE